MKAQLSLLTVTTCLHPIGCHQQKNTQGILRSLVKVGYNVQRLTGYIIFFHCYDADNNNCYMKPAEIQC